MGDKERAEVERRHVSELGRLLILLDGKYHIEGSWGNFRVEVSQSRLDQADLRFVAGGEENSFFKLEMSFHFGKRLRSRRTSLVATTAAGGKEQLLNRVDLVEEKEGEERKKLLADGKAMVELAEKVFGKST